MLNRARLTIAVIGGSGTLGRSVVAELLRRGHDVRAVSRHSAEYRADLRSGEGLLKAIDGCDVVVDASNDMSKAGAEILVEGSRRLLAAEKSVGVGHHICVSIVGCERLPIGYYGIKAAQERVVDESDRPWSIVRSTQFHELIASFFALVARYYLTPVPRVRLQSIASVETAHAVADVAEGAPLGRRISVAGPEIEEVRHFAETWRRITGRRTLLLPLPLPGKFGSALKNGVLADEHPDVAGVISFATWLSSEQTAKTSLESGPVTR